MSFLDVAKEYHQYHHHVSSKRAYGFCSPIWDLVGRSLPTVRRARVVNAINCLLRGDWSWKMR